MFTNRWILTAACSLMLSAGLRYQAAAQDVPEPARQERIDRLIEQLESSRFSDRARATQQLQRFGADAIKPLEEVIRNGSYEAADRAFGILKRNLQSEDPLIADPAQQALQRIAETEGHPKADAAKRILAPTESKSSPGAQPIRPRILPGIPINRKIQVQFKSVNGRKEIKVNEDGRKFRFADEDGGIAVERPDDKGGVKKAKYKDAAEMKKKDPEAHKVYERYSKGGANRIQIQIGQMRGLPIRPPRLQPGIQVPPRIQIQPFPPQQPKPAPEPPQPEPPKTRPKPKADAIEV